MKITGLDTAPLDLAPSTRMALAFGALGKHVYAGTVPLAEKVRRRAEGKRARAARRASR